MPHTSPAIAAMQKLAQLVQVPHQTPPQTTPENPHPLGGNPETLPPKSASWSHHTSILGGDAVSNGLYEAFEPGDLCCKPDTIKAEMPEVYEFNRLTTKSAADAFWRRVLPQPTDQQRHQAQAVCGSALTHKTAAVAPHQYQNPVPVPGQPSPQPAIPGQTPGAGVPQPGAAVSQPPPVPGSPSNPVVAGGGLPQAPQAPGLATAGATPTGGASPVAPGHPTMTGVAQRPIGLDRPQDTRAAALPGVPGHAATNVIDQQGGLDPRGLTVDGNNAAGIKKLAAAIGMCPQCGSTITTDVACPWCGMQKLAAACGVSTDNTQPTQVSKARILQALGMPADFKAGVSQKQAAGNVVGTPQFATTGLLRAITAVNKNQKQAAQMGDHGVIGSGVADSAGRLMTALNITPMVMAGTSAFKNPRNHKEDHQQAMQTLDKARPAALSTTELRLGAPNLWQDMVWKPERDGEDLPWHHQIGGRIMQNPRTSPVGKTFGWATAPLRHLITSLQRSPHYDPFADVAHNMWDNKSVTEHELGHAIDFNSLTNDGKVSPTWYGRLGNGLLRDAYTAAYAVPFANLYHENEANRESNSALMDALPKDKYLERAADRNNVLPAGYGSYLGGHIGRAMGPVGATVGPLVGATLAKGFANEPTNAELFQKRRGEAWDKRHQQPKDGDKDGKVNDGTEDEEDAEKQAELKWNLNMNRDLVGAHTMLGAGIGAAGGALSAALTTPDEEGEQPWVRNTLGGAAMGGLVGQAVSPRGRAYPNPSPYNADGTKDNVILREIKKYGLRRAVDQMETR